MKKEVPPAVVVIIIVLVVVLLGGFMWTRMSGSGLSKVEEDKYLKPLELAPGTTLPAPPPPPQ